jgi:hypothetical protein
MKMPVTLNDMPKAFLVHMLEASYEAFKIPLPEKQMAEVLIYEKLHRAHKEAMAYKKKAAALKKTRAGQARNKVIAQVNAHVKRMENLHDSALRLAEEYGLKDKFFKSEKGEDHESE